MNNVKRAPEGEKAPLLSIIVPVYKVENYLPKCIDSILAQTFTDFELILVDDGSPDDCPALCDAAAEKDARVRVIHQKNGGLSAARNAGLDAARGAWIGFVDSDDYIAPEMYEVLYQAVQSTGADLALCDYAEVDEAGTPCPQMHVSLSGGELTGQELLKRASGLMVQLAWNKLYRRSLLMNAGLWFTREVYNEDQLFNVRYFRLAKAYTALADPGYYYIQNPQSLLHTNADLSKVVNSRLQMFPHYKQMLSELGIARGNQLRLYHTLIAQSERFMPAGPVQTLLKRRTQSK